MQTLFILNDAPYGSERSDNALRLARALTKCEGESVRLFLIGDAVACAKAGQKVPEGYYNARDMVHIVGAEVGVCGSCLGARGIQADKLVEGARGAGLSGKPVSTLGFEKRWNPALAMERTAFIDDLTKEFPPRPAEMGAMVRFNLGLGS